MSDAADLERCFNFILPALKQAASTFDEQAEAHLAAADSLADWAKGYEQGYGEACNRAAYALGSLYNWLCAEATRCGSVNRDHPLTCDRSFGHAGWHQSGACQWRYPPGDEGENHGSS